LLWTWHIDDGLATVPLRPRISDSVRGAWEHTSLLDLSGYVRLQG
jgi:hypothetical protein